MFTPNSRPICIIRSSCTITSERYPAQSVQGAPVCACLTGEMLMCSTIPGNLAESVDENARAERPSRCPPGGGRPQLSTAPRGARPEPRAPLQRGILAHLGARLRRAGQSSRAPRTPFRSAAKVLALLTTLTLSLGFVPSAGAQTTTCGAPDLGGRTEVWSATLTVAPLYLASLPDLLLGYGYVEGDAGSLSNTSFQFNSRTFTVTELASYRLGSITLEIDQGLDNTSGLPTLESLHLHFCDTILDLANPTGTSTNQVLWGLDTLDDPEQADWSTLTTIAVALSKPSNVSPVGFPSVSGTAAFRSTLTADVGGITDGNGLKNAVHTYQWIRVNGGVEIEIPDAVGEMYTLTAEDIGKSIKVVTTFTDDHGYLETRASTATGPVTAVTCAKPSFGDRREVWSATLTVAPLYLASLPDLLLGYGYVEGDAGSLSNTSFQFNSRTFTVTELASYRLGSITLEIDQGLDNTSGLPTLESLHLHFCDTILDLANPTGTSTNQVLWGLDTLDDREQAEADWNSATTIEVALSAPILPK